MEAKRQLDVLNRHLAGTPYLAGDEYTIADMAVWPWHGALARGEIYNAGDFLSVHEYPHVHRWYDAIAGRPAVQRGRRVNRSAESAGGGVAERHSAADLDRGG
jgi:GST-like protein